MSGIILGGTMTAATLTGRRLLDGLRDAGEEVEGWLALGATPRQAVRDDRPGRGRRGAGAGDRPDPHGRPGHAAGRVRRRAVRRAPAGNAARFQLVVLVGLLCAEAITAVTLTWLLGAPNPLPLAPVEPAPAQTRTLRLPRAVGQARAGPGRARH